MGQIVSRDFITAARRVSPPFPRSLRVRVAQLWPLCGCTLHGQWLAGCGLPPADPMGLELPVLWGPAGSSCLAAQRENSLHGFGCCEERRSIIPVLVTSGSWRSEKQRPVKCWPPGTGLEWNPQWVNWGLTLMFLGRGDTWEVSTANSDPRSWF